MFDGTSGQQDLTEWENFSLQNSSIELKSMLYFTGFRHIKRRRLMYQRQIKRVTKLDFPCNTKEKNFHGRKS